MVHGFWLVAVVVHLKGIAPSRGILAVAALKVNAVVLRRTLLAVARTRLRRRSTIARAGIIGGRGLRGCAGARLRATAASFAARRPSAPWLARLAVGHRRLACAAVAVRVVAACGAGRLVFVRVLPTRAIRA